MNIKFICLLLISGIVLTLGCTKTVVQLENVDENDPPSFGERPDPEDLDRSMANSIYGLWKLDDWYDDMPKDINRDGQKSTDLFSQWNGCFKQSELVLSTDPSGKIVYVGMGNNPKCQPGFEHGDFHNTQYWELIEENGIKYLRFIGDDTLDQYEIIELNSTTLILKGAGFLTCCDPDISYYTGGYLRYVKK